MTFTITTIISATELESLFIYLQAIQRCFMQCIFRQSRSLRPLNFKNKATKNNSLFSGGSYDM